MVAARPSAEPVALRALAHPLRLTLLERLSVEGPLTATEVAARLNESPSNCSWHLRKLAEHGLVREAAAVGGRGRPWEAAIDAMSFPIVGDPEADDASVLLERVLLQRSLDRLLDAPRRLDGDDLALAGTQSALMWLTPDEIHELRKAMVGLLARYDGRHRPEAAPPGALLVEAMTWLVPVDPTRPDWPPAGDAPARDTGQEC